MMQRVCDFCGGGMATNEAAANRLHLRLVKEGGYTYELMATFVSAPERNVPFDLCVSCFERAVFEHLAARVKLTGSPNPLAPALSPKGAREKTTEVPA